MNHQQNSIGNSMMELVEIFNLSSTSEETLLDCLAKFNIIGANDNDSFISITRNINIDHLFSIIKKNVSSNSPIGLQILGSSCEVVARIFANLSPVDVIETYGSYIKGSINVYAEKYQLLCLEQIYRLADEGAFTYFMSNPDLIEMSIKFLCEESLSLSSICEKIFKKLISFSGDGWLFSDEFLNLFHQLLSRDAVIKFRIYQVFVDYISKYPEYVEACKNCGIFKSLLEMLLNGDDILGQLNALEIVSQIGISGPQGLDFVKEYGIIGWVSRVICEQGDPLTSFLLPGAVKFVGILCAANPLDIIPQHKTVLIEIFKHLNSNDPTMRSLSAETIAFIASKGEGLKLLYNEFNELKPFMKLMRKIIYNPAEDEHTRKRTVQSLAMMFDHDSLDVEVSMICEKLFRHIDPNPVTFLFELAKRPFAEMRYGSLTLLYNLSKYSWAEQDMVLCPGFMEYLLDRSTEPDREGRELKYNIINNLSISATAKENFGVDYHGKLLKYAAQGPFYSESEVIVSYERED